MDLSTFAGAGGTALGLSLIFLWLFLAGKVHSDPEFRAIVAERDEYKAALAAERQAVNETAATGTVTNQLLSAVVSLASDRKGIPAPRPDLTAEDVGL